MNSVDMIASILKTCFLLTIIYMTMTTDRRAPHKYVDASDDEEEDFEMVASPATDGHGDDDFFFFDIEDESIKPIMPVASSST